ncbi:MAG: hypothetical protein KGN02_09705 [bacterium]|nr:hypothetical protein [bacterium]
MEQSTEPGPRLEHSDQSWSDAQTLITTGTEDPLAAAWYLTTSRIWPLMTNPRLGPIVLGIALFVIIVATVLFSPSTESHFIYTDF